MPKHSSHILELARRGAEHRLAELQTEIAALIKDFPHLRSSARGRRPQIDTSAEPAAVMDRTPRKRKRRGLSAAGRAAISAAQKKRWAAIKKKKTVGKSS